MTESDRAGTGAAIARRLDGASAATAIREALAPRIATFRQVAARPPALGILLAGNDPASEIYVRSKVAHGEALGLSSDVVRLPASASLDEALSVVERFNASDAHDGILVQAPLPAGMGAGAAARVFEAIDPAKDVDGFHPANVGRLVQGRPSLTPCTPAGVIELLDRNGIAIAGARAVVIGRSDIVGKPLALLLLHRHATVTLCHSRTRDLPAVARAADILVAAVGRPAFVTRDFVQPGAAVVDVGVNRLTDAADVLRIFGPESPKQEAYRKRGAVLAGDVHPEVMAVAGALSPVPGGVGPLTIAMLMSNTVLAAERRRHPLAK